MLLDVAGSLERNQIGPSPLGVDGQLRVGEVARLVVIARRGVAVCVVEVAEGRADDRVPRM